MDISKEISAFCQNVQYIRKKYFLSVKSLAMLLDICEDDLLQIESGHLPKHITVQTLFRLHNIFDIPADAFFAESL